MATARKSPARKMKRFRITADALPGVIFFSLSDLRDGCHDALTERRAIDEYKVDGVEEALFDTLHGLGWEYADIATVAHGAEMVTSYGMPAAYGEATAPAPRLCVPKMRLHARRSGECPKVDPIAGFSRAEAAPIELARAPEMCLA
jgi:hypothetical protein